MSIAELKSIMPPPLSVDSIGASQWSEVETALGTNLPQDYKDFISIYGSGKIADFISVFSPFSENPNLNLVNQLSQQSGVLLELSASGEVLPYAAFPADDGIVPVGMTDNGDVIYWRTSEVEWSVVVNAARVPDWVPYNLSLVDFLVEILSGRAICSIFPRLPLTPPINFTPAK